MAPQASGMDVFKAEPQGEKRGAGSSWCYGPLQKGKATIWVQSTSQQLEEHTGTAVV